MKAVVIGKGSIGRRHKTILKNFCKEVIFISSRDFLSKKMNLNEIVLNPEKTIIFICSATKFHMEVLKRIKFFKLNIFIEKPVICEKKEISFFIKFIKKYKLKIFNGYMLRNDPRILLLKNEINKNIKDVKYAKFNLQTNMPKWHLNEDYRKNYANNKKLGGGVLLTCTHEIDLSIMLFGPAKKVFCTIHKSKLINDVENSVSLILFHSNNIRSELTLDFENNHTKKRYCEVYLKNSFFKWDFFEKFILIEKNYKVKKKYPSKSSEINKIYVYQINNLFNSIKSKTKVIEKLLAEKVVFAAKKSIESNRVEKV